MCIYSQIEFIGDAESGHLCDEESAHKTLEYLLDVHFINAADDEKEVSFFVHSFSAFPFHIMREMEFFNRIVRRMKQKIIIYSSKKLNGQSNNFSSGYFCVCEN